MATKALSQICSSSLRVKKEPDITHGVTKTIMGSVPCRTSHSGSLRIPAPTPIIQSGTPHRTAIFPILQDPGSLIKASAAHISGVCSLHACWTQRLPPSHCPKSLYCSMRPTSLIKTQMKMQITLPAQKPPYAGGIDIHFWDRTTPAKTYRAVVGTAGIISTATPTMNTVRSIQPTSKGFMRGMMEANKMLKRRGHRNKIPSSILTI
mmetsp:Transcript_71718/g.135470  ORF Transcript_71718/g.135470 Transcript_71718/m.135470 type:complete len:207 (+) Transcript_71718:1-621(+)